LVGFSEVGADVIVVTGAWVVTGSEGVLAWGTGVLVTWGTGVAVSWLMEDSVAWGIWVVRPKKPHANELISKMMMTI
jgi:hypothetical protein